MESELESENKIGEAACGFIESNYSSLFNRGLKCLLLDFEKFCLVVLKFDTWIGQGQGEYCIVGKAICFDQAQSHYVYPNLDSDVQVERVYNNAKDSMRLKMDLQVLSKEVPSIEATHKAKDDGVSSAKPITGGHRAHHSSSLTVYHRPMHNHLPKSVNYAAARVSMGEFLTYVWVRIYLWKSKKVLPHDTVYAIRTDDKIGFLDGMLYLHKDPSGTCIMSDIPDLTIGDDIPYSCHQDFPQSVSAN
ncbi:uncharacterized protein P174DRAFT_508059 [Aspergillus novofumigatus IBT 16806]|uniref:Uncharacterized protein n=1 Tax=Aspergillus novofumigatus (strain IBT 16806) TaxID=1392255 RepID=A0A2I1BTW4_ASPN1|nr:uncharacterized protein P174DRAFT_508059 [Aspergillus novofumigatus IBT 16806]PKX88838.1 hypothetical protein P174DRAFT_508059 [Aspergillus novofumigatus IBT 16806]